MKNISTGAGLVVLGLGIALHPLVSGLVAQATAAPSSSSAAAAVASVAAAQAGPAVVWYGTAGDATGYSVDRLYRAWSDGTVELKRVSYSAGNGGYLCSDVVSCASPWMVISSPNQGYRAAADLNADELVDGVDLASVLGNWGDAPRVPFPPSDCPLNLINP